MANRFIADFQLTILILGGILFWSASGGVEKYLLTTNFVVKMFHHYGHNVIDINKDHVA